MAPLPSIITKARARLLFRAPFLGSIALGLEWVCAPEIGTMATDGRRVWLNPHWCEEHGIDKTMGVIAHEVFHVVNKHHLRRGERDSKLWNVAGDLLINRLLEDDNYILPSDGLFDRERRYAGLPTETIYARLLEEQTSQQSGRGQQQTIGGQSSNHSIERNNATGPANPDQQASQTVGAGGASITNDGNLSPARHWGEVRDLTAPNGKPLSPAQRRQAEHSLDVRIRQAAVSAKRTGRFSAGYEEVINVATNKVDWRDKFRISFDGLLRGEVSWTRPNRRFVQHGLYLPGWRRIGPGRIAYVLDTSGSISAHELAIYTAGVLGILEETAPEEIALIQCDARVRHVDYLQPGETFDRIEVHGRGGTRFQPAFDWIADSGLEFRAVIYATDLDCTDEPQDPGLPIIWLTPKHHRTMPFGEIVEVRL
jgi:predicted metal-dependent peptidase